MAVGLFLLGIAAYMQHLLESNPIAADGIPAGGPGCVMLTSGFLGVVSLLSGLIHLVRALTREGCPRVES